MTKIGFFDSGIGGLFILNAVAKEVPGMDFFYISDDAAFPYGAKTEAEILERSFYLSELLLKEGVGHIVIACNTATAVAIDILREKYPQVTFIGVEPYINIINKVENTAHLSAVLVTPSTAKSKRFINLKNRLDPKNLVDIIPLENLAGIAEEIFYNGETVQLAEKVALELSPIKGKYHQVILGCTHYLHIENLISKFLNTKCISPADAIAKRVKDKVSANSSEISSTYTLLNTSKNIWERKNL